MINDLRKFENLHPVTSRYIFLSAETGGFGETAPVSTAFWAVTARSFALDSRASQNSIRAAPKRKARRREDGLWRMEGRIGRKKDFGETSASSVEPLSPAAQKIAKVLGCLQKPGGAIHVASRLWRETARSQPRVYPRQRTVKENMSLF